MTADVVAYRPCPRPMVAAPLGAVLCRPAVLRRLAAGDPNGAIDAVNAGFTYGAEDATSAMSYLFAMLEARADAG